MSEHSHSQPAITRAQTRAIDHAAIHEHGIPGLQLMENASRAVADEAVAMLGGDVTGRAILVLCGGGNNGGDGFAAARMLDEAGARARVIALRPFDRYTGDAKTNLNRCLDRGMDVIDASDDPMAALRHVDPPDLVIDALLGTGITSPVRPPVDRVIDWISASDAAVLAVDIPSGLDCDTGKPLGAAVQAHTTVTFIANKIGFTRPGAEPYIGRVVVADIGTPPHLLREMASSQAHPFHGRVADLYDIFVDWSSRLAREMPALRTSLDAIGARGVLDVGCGTGQHARALLDAGYDVHAADASPSMLAQATERIGGAARVHRWALGEVPPDSLTGLAPFDALTCLGNTWSQLVADQSVSAALRECLGLLRPGGLMLVGLKALAVRRAAGNPYMPLLKRRHQGHDLFFIRFVDFDTTDPRTCDFHMLVAGADLHATHRIRVWSYKDLTAAFTAAGFVDVKLSASMADPADTPTGEDVFVHAKKS
jgi:NAD(P)H-hydrate epimerase